MTGATLAALGENGSMIFSAGHNLTMDTDSLEAKKDMTENSDNYIRTYRKTETANTLTAGKDISLISGNDIKARSTTVASENGQVSMKAANDVTIENGYNEAMDDYGLKYKESGFLSKKTTAIKSHDESKTATGSMLSGEKVGIISGESTTITASNVVGTNDVSITSGKNTTITSAEEVEQHDYEKRVKKSGLLSGGLGFTIGSEKRNDQYADTDVTQKGSTVGSIAGNVTIEANKDVHVNASDIIAGKDISMTGENVDISSKDNVYHSDEKHEYKKSGLTVSVSGGVADVLTDTMNNIRKASSARDKQLKVLYGGEVYETIAKNKKMLKDIKGKGMPGISVGIGSSSFKAENHTETTEAVESNLVSNNDIHITAKKDIEMKGSQIIGDNVSMNAGENITLSAAENRSSSDTKESSKSSQAGMSFAPTGNSFYANASKGQGNETEGIFTHTSSQVIARKDLTTESGKDTTLRGSNAYGDKVTIKAGGNLAIESVQDKDSYTSHNESKGMGLSIGSMKKTTDNNKMKSSLKGGLAVGTSKSNIDSTYESVTNQAGITAGSQGYDVSVKDTTHLKGGLIDSHASQDKNTLTTGTLVWEDIENKADYKATASGRNYSASWSPKETVGDKKIGGLTGGTSPVKSQPVKGKADSTTKSAVSEGAITITDKEHQKQDISDLNRDTKNTLNQLEKIFDKDTIRERQELANEFAKLGAEKIGDIAKEKNWSPNDPRRSLLHGLLGGISAKLGGNSILSGAASGATMEGLQPILDTFLKDHQEMREDVSSLIGYTTGKLLGGDGETGSAVAWNGTKFNWLSHEQYNEYLKEWDAAKTQKGKKAIEEKYREIDNRQNDEWLKGQDSDIYYNPWGTYGEAPYIYMVTAKRNALPSNKGPSMSQILISLGENTASEFLNDPWERALANLSGKVKTGVSWGLRLGGTAGIAFTTIDAIQDYRDYSGSRLWQAWGADTLPAWGGFIGGIGGIPGSIAGSTVGDLAKSNLKNKIPTDKQLKEQNDTKEKPKDE